MSRDLDRMALAPCHAFFQFYVAENRLSCQLYQRSADLFLGVPFNIASYALLTMMVAQVTGLEPGTFVHTFGDAHIYLNHLEQVEEQLARDPRPLPTMRLDDQIEDLFEFRFEHFELLDYDPASAHRRPGGRLKPDPLPMRISLIVAAAENNVIGRDGDLPWHLPVDLRFFKNTTMGHPVIMGRRTWESFEGGLPGRACIVVTRNQSLELEGATVATSLEAALAEAGNAQDVFVAGGGEIYRMAMEMADRIVLTRVHAQINGDCHISHAG